MVDLSDISDLIKVVDSLQGSKGAQVEGFHPRM